MPGTTPNRHYPYPLGPDALNPRLDIKALAEAVDADFSAQVTTSDLTTALAGYLRLTGGAVTGLTSFSQSGSAASLSIRNASNTPYVEWRSYDAATRYGYLQLTPTAMVHRIDSASGLHTFLISTTEKFRVSSTGALVTGNLTVSGNASVTGDITSSGDLAADSIAVTGLGSFGGDVHAIDVVLTGNVTATGVARFGSGAFIGGDGNQLNLIDTVVTTAGTSLDVQLNFYGQGTTTAPGTRAGYVGYVGTDVLRLVNATSGADLYLQTTGAGNVLIYPGASGEIWFQSDATYQGKMSGADFMWGKAASDLANAGVEMFGAGSSAEGAVRSTVVSASIGNFYARHQGSTSTVFNGGEPFAEFNLNGTIIGSITQVGTSGTNYGESSDYRLKTDLGPVVDPLARLIELIPRHLSWKSDSIEFDGFFAHEVQALVPAAVAGAKDAVYPASDDPGMPPAGTILPQQLDATKLVPLLVAAVQELAREVADLKAGA